MQATLRHREWEIFTFAPIQAVEHVAWAALGLADMLNSGGALLKDSLQRTDDGVVRTGLGLAAIDRRARTQHARQ